MLELDPNDDMAIKKTYIYADSQILAQHDGDSSDPRYFYLHDRLGSVRLVINNEGVAQNSYTYNPFGESFDTECTENVTNPFKFTGQFYDSEIGQYYLRARMYDPQLMRFTGRDPVNGKYQESLTLHKYLYCLNDPVNRTDPLGEKSLAELMGSVKIWATGVATTCGNYLAQSWQFVKRVIQQVNQAQLMKNVIMRGQDIWSRGNLKLIQAYNTLYGSGITGKAQHVGSRAFGANQQALLELSKQATRTGVTREQAKILIQWAIEYGIPSRSDIGTNHWQYGLDHIHILGYHIKIIIEGSQ